MTLPAEIMYTLRRTSLPTPVSPVIRIDIFIVETACASFMISRMMGEVPVISAKVYRVPSAILTGSASAAASARI